MSRKKPFSFEQFKTLYSQVPRLVVEIVVTTEKGIVLTLRDDEAWKNLWHIPGGTVFYQESVEDAVQRVAMEELGISVKIEKLLGYMEYPSEIIHRGFGWPVSLAFLCSSNSPIPDINEEGEKIQVFDYIPENTIPEHKEILKNVLQARE